MRQRILAAHRVALVALGGLFLGACSDDAQFTTRFASDFVPARHTVSVLGIFKDGQMSADAWDSIGAKLSTPFGQTCDSAYGALIGSNQILSSAIDDYVRANGPGDDLLEQLVPAATGDLIAVFIVAGHVNTKTAAPDTGAIGGSSPMSGTSSKYRGMRPTQGTTRGMARPNQTAALEVALSLYSVQTKRSVGQVTMQYDGTNLDEALQKMAAKVGLMLPATVCAGWDWKAKVDDNRIRALIEQ